MGTIVGVESAYWRRGLGIVQTEVCDLPCQGNDWAGEWFAAEPKSNDFPTDAVLLCGENKANKGRTSQIVRGCFGTQHLALTDVECDITETKGCIVARWGSVLARATEKEKCHTNHVGDRQRFDTSMLTCKIGGVMDDLHRDWFDASGWVISLGISSELTTESKFCFAGGS